MLFFVSCSNKEALKALECTDILNEVYLQKAFQDSRIIPLSAYRKEGNDAKNCEYTFSIGEKSYEASLTLEVLGDATEAMFEQSVAGFKDKKFLMNFGEKAYIYPLGLAYEITVFSDTNLIRGYILEDDGNTLTFERKMSKKLLFDMLEKLDLS